MFIIMVKIKRKHTSSLNFIPSQFMPSPEKPGLQTQVNEPGELSQVEFEWHRLSAHSSISITEDKIHHKFSSIYLFPVILLQQCDLNLPIILLIGYPSGKHY